MQAIYSSSPADMGHNDRFPSKDKSPHFPPKQLTRSQQMDEILDVLIESGVSASGSAHTIGGGSGGAMPKFHRHYGPMSPPQPMPYEHSVSHGDCHLEALLSSSMGRQNDIVLLKIGGEDSSAEEINEGGSSGGFGNSHHDDKMLSNREMIDTPLSPMVTKVSSIVPVEGQALGMTFTESPWETMEWLDLTPPSSATGFNTMPSTGQSIFNTEFLDVSDINLTSTMDLHLEHW